MRWSNTWKKILSLFLLEFNGLFENLRHVGRIFFYSNSNLIWHSKEIYYPSIRSGSVSLFSFDALNLLSFFSYIYSIFSFYFSLYFAFYASFYLSLYFVFSFSFSFSFSLSFSLSWQFYTCTDFCLFDWGEDFFSLWTEGKAVFSYLWFVFGLINVYY